MLIELPVSLTLSARALRVHLCNELVIFNCLCFLEDFGGDWQFGWDRMDLQGQRLLSFAWATQNLPWRS